MCVPSSVDFDRKLAKEMEQNKLHVAGKQFEMSILPCGWTHRFFSC